MAPGLPGASAPGDESALVAALRAGDEAAFEKLVRAYGGRLLAVAKRIVRNDEDAADAVQEGFISAFRAIDRFEGGALLSTWLHRIVVNSALMKLRSRKRSAEESIEDLLPTFMDDGHQDVPAAEWSVPADQTVLRDETRSIVRAAIDRLPDTYRTVLLLRDIEELDTEEAAAALGITSNAVKIRLHRARQALRTLLDPHFSKGQPGRNPGETPGRPGASNRLRTE
jgi:RNA polymerase sigma-70 factor (ECF subfamily)